MTSLYQPFFQKAPQSPPGVEMIVGQHTDQANQGEKESIGGLAVGRAGKLAKGPDLGRMRMVW